MSKERIFLVKPPLAHISSAVAPPLGLLYLTSYIRDKFGDYYDIKLVDMRISITNINRLSNIIKKYKPGVVGISACSEDDRKLHEIASTVKRLDSSIFIVAGGPHATMYHKDILRDKNIDISVIGEGEITFYEILRNIRKGKDFKEVKGVAYRRDGGIHINPPRDFIENLDNLPFPAWDLLEVKKYSNPKIINMNVILCRNRYMGLVTSRGCPYNCIYCHNIFGKRFRKRSAENVFKEIKNLVEEYDIGEFQIFDDIFNLDAARVHELCDMIISAGLDIKLSFPNGIRGDIIDKKLLLKLKKAGVYMLTFALECASERIQKLIRKNIDKEKLLQNIRFADRIGLLTKCYLMIGFPTETIEEINQTIDFACRAPLCFASFFIVNPHRGTELFRLVRGFFPEFNTDFDSSYYYTENRNYEKMLGIPLKKIQGHAYRKFYYNPQRMLKLYTRIPRKIFLAYNFLKFMSFF